MDSMMLKEMPGDGQTMIEVGLIVALVSVVAIVALTGVGNTIRKTFETVWQHLVDANTTNTDEASGYSELMNPSGN